MSVLLRLYRGQNDIAFPKWWRRGLILSGILILISVLSFFTRGLNLGIDFVGGVSWEVKAPNVSVSKARDALGTIGQAADRVQIVGTDTLRVEALKASTAKLDQVRDVMAKLGNTSTSQVSVSTVGPSWGQDITHKAEQALVVFLLALLVYLSIRLEWKMAVGAILAMIHDVIISVGVYSVFQFEVTPETVIAFLTILGYSIYDTIVVFDKVRENQARPAVVQRLTYTDLTSLSMNQVLMRSINTSIVALLPVVSMLVVGAGFLGAVTLEEFSIALLVGMLSGAYSSIFIAAPIVVALKEREPRNRALRRRIESGRVAPPTEAEITAEIDDDDETAAAAPVGAGAKEATTPDGAVRSTSTATAVAATARPQAIPPRPRKKGKRR